VATGAEWATQLHDTRTEKQTARSRAGLSDEGTETVDSPPGRTRSDGDQGPARWQHQFITPDEDAGESIIFDRATVGTSKPVRRSSYDRTGAERRAERIGEDEPRRGIADASEAGSPDVNQRRRH
jgi:hypothetical protein